MRVDLNADLGEGFGPWAMGDDAAMLDVVSSANVACGGHAGDPETMFATLRLAAAIVAGVVAPALMTGTLVALTWAAKVMALNWPLLSRFNRSLTPMLFT